MKGRWQKVFSFNKDQIKMVIFAANFICALIGKIVIYKVAEMENLEKNKVERKT